MSIYEGSTNVVANYQTAEYGKFLQLTSSDFPAISVTRVHYPDRSEAFPENALAASLTSTDIYPKYAVLSHITNPSDISTTVNVSGSNVYINLNALSSQVAQTNLLLSNILSADNSIAYHNQAIDLNTYDTLTAVAAFNNNYIASLPSLTSVYVVNPNVTNVVSISTTQILPISGNVYVTNPVSINTTQTLPISGNVNTTNTVSVSTTQTLPVSVINTQIEITNDAGNPVPVSTNSNTLAVSGNVTITNVVTATPIGTQNVTFVDSPQLNEASRLRVATPQTQWWFMATVDKDGDLRYNESFVGGASSIYVQNLASVNMTSGTTSVSGQALRASRRRHKIIPGNSHEYVGVWNWDGQHANVVKRIGIFTQFNGYFFELSGTDAMNAVVRRRLPDGTLVEERVNQTAWNGDKLDGTGPSGENWNALTQTATITGWISTTPVTINSTLSTSVWNVVYGLSAGQVQNFRQGTKATITGITSAGYNAIATIVSTDSTTNRLTATYLFNPGVSAGNVTAGSMVQTGYHMQHTYWIDFMGGRTNRIRFGKASDYGKIVLQTFRFDGLLGTAYENAPTLTERKEIFNIGTPTSLPSFTVMGNAFNIEANVDITPNFNVAYNNNGIPFAADNVERPVLGIALRPGEPYQRGDIQIQNISIMDLGNNAITSYGGGAGGTIIYPSTYFWRLVLNPGLSGVPASTNIGKASRQWAYTTSSALTSNVIELMAGYTTSNAPTSQINTALNFLNMGSNIDNTDSDKVVLMLKCLSVGTNTTGVNASSAVATMNFVEAL